ncbi:hypothetical protein HK405_004066 [Cladochytrium tenue]|nr:hypothetical protein HK405_004066 [Cladochytrium tenue]
MIHPKFKVAAIQSEPAWLDLAAGITKTCDLIAEAAAEGAKLIVFPETWIPGYPNYIWMMTVVQQFAFTKRYIENSLALDGPEMLAIRRAAKTNKIVVSLGFSERSSTNSLYISDILIGADGQILMHRRKLKPTHMERTLFGDGNVVKTDSMGVISSLNCWEHLQPLTKFTLYCKGAQVHCSHWPCFGLQLGPAFSGETNTMMARSMAVEGQCFVIVSSQTVTESGMAIFEEGREERKGVLQAGGGYARIYGPTGILLSPVLPETQDGIVYAEIDLLECMMAKTAADPGGHYARADITRLVLNDIPELPITTTSTLEAEKVAKSPLGMVGLPHPIELEE